MCMCMWVLFVDGREDPANLFIELDTYSPPAAIPVNICQVPNMCLWLATRPPSIARESLAVQISSILYGLMMQGSLTHPPSPHKAQSL